MKKGQIYTGTIETMEFPNKGIAYIDGEKAIVKNALPGQKVEFVINKKRNGRCEGRLMKVLAPSPLETADGAVLILESAEGALCRAFLMRNS